MAVLALAPVAARTVWTADAPGLVLHGEARRDEYSWLRAGADDPAVRRHLAAENRYAEEVMRPHRPLLATLAREIEAQAYADEESAPVRRGTWL